MSATAPPPSAACSRNDPWQAATIARVVVRPERRARGDLAQSRSVVGDREVHPVTIGVCVDVHVTTVSGSTHGVVEHAGQRPAQRHRPGPGLEDLDRRRS